MSARRRRSRSSVGEERFEPAPLDGPLLEVVDLKTALQDPAWARPRRRRRELLARAGQAPSASSASPAPARRCCRAAIMGLLPKKNVERSGTAIFEGHDLVDRERRRAPRPLGRADGDGLPGPDDVAEPGDEDRQPDHRDAAPAPRHHEGLRQGARPRPAAVGRDPRGRAAAEGVPAPDVGRDAPARRDRDRDRLRPEAPLRRRAHHRARRDRAGPDPGPAPGAAARALHGDDPRHPRPRRRGRTDRRDRGDVRRACRGEGTDPNAVRLGCATRTPRRSCARSRSSRHRATPGSPRSVAVRRTS